MNSSTEKRRKGHGQRTEIDMAGIVLSWSLEDIVYGSLFQNKVKKIPDEFISEEDYLESFKLPLLEETRADLSSALDGISKAPLLKIQNMELQESKSYPLYNMELEIRDIGTSQARNGDILLLSSVKPVPVHDLLRYNFTYSWAMVKEVLVDEGLPKGLKIRVSERVDTHDLNECVYAVSLTNITSYIRIWRALGFETGVMNNFTRRVLSPRNMENTISDFWKNEKELVGPHEKILSVDLNESQLNVVKTTISAVQCERSNSSSVNLVWGPPGTGKTKTVSTILWTLRQSNFRSLTCAPTNVAIAGVCTRVIRLLKHFGEGNDCLGDVVLFGNVDRIDMTDELLDVFLPNRVSRLIDCFSPSTGCKHRISSMIGLLEDPVSEYNSYIEKSEPEKNDSSSFPEFLRKQFINLGNCLQDLIVHYPRSQLSHTNYSTIISLMDLLNNFCFQLGNRKMLSDEQLKGVFENVPRPGSSVEKSLRESRVECLKLLRGLNSSLDLPVVKDGDWIRDFCLQHSSLIFCTVSNSFSLHNLEVGTLDVLVIDEAAQLKECESVIPLRLGGIKHAILVGDEKQLPAMVQSKVCEKAGFGRSLFKRLVSLGHEKHLLNIQYRMHPSISRFPNHKFYGDKILDGQNVRDDRYNDDFSNIVFGSYALLNVVDGREESDDMGNSKLNLIEAGVVLHLIKSLFESWKNRSNKDIMLTVGVISFYAAQINMIKQKVGARYNAHDGFRVRVKSVDGFQGEEDDVVILSTVRCNTKGAIGFVDNNNRTNVAITRAKHCLWIVGNVSTLSKSGTIWEDIVIDAQNRNCLFNANDHKELKNAILHVQTELDHLGDLLNSDSMLFSTATWKVLFRDEFRKSFTKLESKDSKQTKRDAINLLVQIASGWRSKRKNVANVSDSFNLARIYRMGDLYLVWSTDLERQEMFMQIIRVWDLVPLTQVERLVKRMNHIFSKYTDAYIERCRAVCLERTMEVPMTWHDRHAIKFRKDPQNLSADEDNSEPDSAASSSMECSKVNESLLLMKFYSLSSGAAKHLLTARDGSELDVLFELNDQEKEIIRFPLSSFILGRSGTGKTTVLTTKLVQKEQQYILASRGVHSRDVGTSKDVLCRDYVESKETESSLEDSFVKQVLITVSPKLCSAIKNHISRFRRFASDDDSFSQADWLDMHDIIGKLDDFADIPDTFVDLDQKHYPLVITFRKFLMMVDGTMESSFFDRFYAEWGVSCKSGVKKSHALQTIIQSMEVHFEKFVCSYWPHFNCQMTKKLDPSIVFTQIVSHIKGGSNLVEGKLGREEYMKLSDKRFSSLDGETRGKIYDIFLNYEIRKRAKREFDLSDFVSYLHYRLNQDGFKGDKLDFVYIDEVQDLTTRQIALFKHICTNFKEGFVVAGDTAQTIAKGVDFRFEDIRSLFYTDFLSINQEKELRVTDMFQLQQNFRTHRGVLKLAQSVMDILYFYFPHSVDKLAPETSLVDGEAPILLKSGVNNNALVTIFGEEMEESSGQEFGAEQAIIVRDESAKKKVLEFVGKRALVLTIVECKGLEFQDVLLYDFFASSPLDKKWRVVYGFMENQEIFDSSIMTKSYPSFDLKMHHLLCSELKQLYVAITRTRQRLWICESSDEICRPLYDYWKRLCLVKVQQLDRTTVQAMRNTSSMEDWKKRGIKLFDERHYEMAATCFEKAADAHREKWARAAGLVANADKLLGSDFEMGRTMLCKAAAMYESIDKHETAASCYIKIGDFVTGATIYLEKCGPSRLEDAGDCFAMAEKWPEAADAYFKAKCISKCLSTCTKGELFEEGLSFLNTWNEERILLAPYETKFEDLELIREGYIESSVQRIRQLRDTKRMLPFLQSAFESVDMIRLFLISRGFVDELLVMEIDAGNFPEALNISRMKGDVLLEALVSEKAGLREKAVHLILFYVRATFLWSSDNWPTKPFDKEEFIRKAKHLSQRVSARFSESVHLEADLLAYPHKSLVELSECLIKADEFGNISSEFLSTRAILNMHLSEHDKYVLETEPCSSLETQSRELASSMLTPNTLVYIWSRFRDILARMMSCFDSLKTNSTKDENKVYGEFCVEFFGVRKYGDEDRYVMLNPNALWVRSSGEESLQQEKNQCFIKTSHFVYCAQSYLSRELVSNGVQVLEKLESIMRSHHKQGSMAFGGMIPLSMYQVVKFLRGLDIGENDNDKLKRFCNIYQCWFWDAIFPHDWRNGVGEFISKTLNHASVVELFDELLDSTVGSECVNLTHGQLGKIAMILFSTGKLTNERFSKFKKCLVDKPEWMEFLKQLKINFLRGYERPFAPSVERRVKFLVCAFQKALKATFEVNWRSESDYISPNCFLYLLDRLIFLISSCCGSLGYMITTRSSVSEMLKLGGLKSYFDSPLQVVPRTKRLVSFDFSLNSIQALLRNTKETREWIQKCGLPDEFYGHMVLKLVIMFYIVNLNTGFDMCTSGKFLLDNGVFDDLPPEFSQKIHQSIDKSVNKGDFDRYLSVIADAFMVIGDPLVVIGSGNKNPLRMNSKVYFVSCDDMRSRDAMVLVLFPEGIIISPRATVTGEISEDLALTPPVIEETGENDEGRDCEEKEDFWDKFEAFQQKNNDQRNLKEIMDFLESVLSWFNGGNDKPEGLDELFIEKIRNLCVRFRKLSISENAEGQNPKDLNAIQKDDEGALQEILDKLARYKELVEIYRTENETIEELKEYLREITADLNARGTPLP